MRKRLVLVLVPLLVASTCVPRVNIQSAPSPAARPAFTFSTRGAPLVSLREFEVTQCRPVALRRPLWQVRRHHGETDTLVTWEDMRGREGDDAFRIMYGEVPEGFRQLVAPEPLAPGRCYLAVAGIGYGRGLREFRVTPDGRVELGESSGYYRHGESEMNRAGVHCKRVYHAARSPADTLAADARAFAVADTSVACGYLRREQPYVLSSALSRELRVGILVTGFLSIAWGIIEEIGKE
jgi:hypothetical protein